MSSLLQMPRDVSQVVATLLEPEELRVLACICRAAAINAAFNPPRTETLILPPTDAVRARRLLTTLYRQNPTRLARFEWVQIATPWHVDLLTVAAGVVHSVRVRTEVANSPVVSVDGDPQPTVETICDKLSVALPHLTRLDLSSTGIHRVTDVAKMTQLRYLNLTGTEVVDATPLASLVHLEEFVYNDAHISDMTWIQHMAELRHLKVVRKRGYYIKLPSLRALTKLHTIRVGLAGIVSRSDFVESLVNLRHLAVSALHERCNDHSADGSGRTATHLCLDELVPALPFLETIHDGRGAVSTAVLSTIPTLRAITHAISSEAELLVGLLQLKELRLKIPSRPPPAGPQDYRFLLRFPALTTVTVDQPSLIRDEGFATAELESLVSVLAEMPQLQSLRLECLVDSDNIPPLVHVKNLFLIAQRNLKSLDWIKPCHSLRSLSVRADPSETDLSAISSLTQLEELTLNSTSIFGGGPDDYPFLHKLINLRTLMIAGNITDVGGLRGMSKLRTLTIVSKCPRPMANVEALGCLPFLRNLDISRTNIHDLRPLVAAKRLRRIVIARNADCRPLAACDHPSLLRVLHPDKNCLWSCKFGTIDEEQVVD
jgi:Leucine-rich repeat (LRR) protein